jgi:hypothetical protein
MNETVPTHNIGGYVPLVDGPEKVSGRAKYTADLLAPGLLAGRIFRSPYSHGEILEVDVAEALRLPGVKAIVTGADCDKTFGVLPIARSEHPLARDRVRYRGEHVPRGRRHSRGYRRVLAPALIVGSTITVVRSQSMELACCGTYGSDRIGSRARARRRSESTRYPARNPARRPRGIRRGIRSESITYLPRGRAR